MINKKTNGYLMQLECVAKTYIEALLDNCSTISLQKIHIDAFGNDIVLQLATTFKNTHNICVFYMFFSDFTVSPLYTHNYIVRPID